MGVQAQRPAWKVEFHPSDCLESTPNHADSLRQRLLQIVEVIGETGRDVIVRWLVGSKAVKEAGVKHWASPFLSHAEYRKDTHKRGRQRRCRTHKIT